MGASLGQFDFMKTPLLIDVPKTHPSRKERMTAFKTANGIETHNYGVDAEYMCWTAAHMPSVYTLGYGVKEGMGLGECASLVYRLMEEAGYCAYGTTEREAIRNVCKNVGIVCTL